MKVGTVGALAALGMMLTSVTVWSWTPPGGFSDELGPDNAVVVEAAGDPDDPDTSVDRSLFVSSGTLGVEARLGHAVLQSGKDTDSYVFVNVKADSQAVASTPSPLNLSIVVDRSGSMKGKRLQNALDAARGMVRRLRDGDAVSVVAYNTSTETVVPVTRVDSSSRDRIVRAITGITASGDTCISCGIDKAMTLLRQRSGMVNRILLLSDGEATAGVRDVPGFREIAARCRRMGASVTTIGVDVDYNERVMAAVAQESNGRHFFVENVASLPRIFDQELESLVRTVAKNAEAVIELAPGVQVERVFDRSFRREGNRIVVPLGTFSAADQKSVLVQIRVPRGAEGERSIADVRLAYTDLVSDGPASQQGELIAMMTTDPARASDLDPLVSGRLSRSETVGALEEANRLFAAGKVADARRIVSKKRDELAARGRTSANKAPAKRKKEVSFDFEQQVAALDEAESGFADAPAASPSPATGGSFAQPPAPAQSREGKAAVRRNQSAASDLAF